MDEIIETTTDSFALEIAKSFALSAATTVGIVAGFVVVGLAANKYREFRENRAKKNANN